MRLNNTFAERQTNSGTASSGGEKWQKNLVFNFIWNADSVVFYT